MSSDGDPDTWPDGPHLTPLGPGGRPLARWRKFTAALAVVVAGLAVLAFLSPRAPDRIDAVTERVAARVDDRAPEAGAAARRAVDRSGVDEPDALAHVGLWSAVALIAGLSTWSWRSLTVLAVGLVVASTGLELAQQRLSPTRTTEWPDVVANLGGLGLGFLVVIALTSVTGLPALVRRFSERSGRRA